MDWIGWVFMFIVICYSSYPGKVKKLERKVKKLEGKAKGETHMSKIITALIGKNCKIKTEEDSAFSTSTEVECTIIDADDEWIKFSFADKKDVVRTQVIRIESIESVELIDK